MVGETDPRLTSSLTFVSGEVGVMQGQLAGADAGGTFSLPIGTLLLSAIPDLTADSQPAGSGGCLLVFQAHRLRSFASLKHMVHPSSNLCM